MSDLSDPEIDMSTILAVQEEIRLPLPLVQSNVDYDRLKRLLEYMDQVLKSSGVEDQFVTGVITADAQERGKAPSERRTARLQKFARRSLRCTVARLLSEESFRNFSTHLADSHLLRAFCGYDGLADQSPAKSTLQRMFEDTTESELRKLVEQVVLTSSKTGEDGVSRLGLQDPTSIDAAFLDSTCIELNIHHPTDWVLLRDLVRSVIQRIIVIRNHGLLCRMVDPREFIRQINALSIQMTNSSRRGGKKKRRKETLRKMKKLVATVCAHGERHLARLEKSWKNTELSCAQKDHIGNRLRDLLALKTRVVKQAHERIIGERSVKNDTKILSLYEQHASVYVRGKAGAECEFGLQCLVAESVDGLIMDWDVPGNQIVPDSKSLLPSIERMQSAYGDKTIKAAITDRGFTSQANSKILAAVGIEDYTLPRNPHELKERMQNSEYARLHRRRAQTEARIGIFKNCFVRRTVPAKGLDNQRVHIAWAALTHNLWVIARIIEADRAQQNAAA